MSWRLRTIAGLVPFIFMACGSRTPERQPVEVVGSGKPEASAFALTSLRGTRDGDRVAVQAAFGNGARSLVLQLRFRLTPQAKLDSGTWVGLGGEGAVKDSSVTFLGGQSGPPSIGGRFDLTDSGGAAIYRVHIPLQPLQDTL